jgi:hypothetical protein
VYLNVNQGTSTAAGVFEMFSIQKKSALALH